MNSFIARPQKNHNDSTEESVIHLLKGILPKGFTITKPLGKDCHYNIHYNRKKTGLRIDVNSEGVFISTYHLTIGDLSGNKKNSQFDSCSFGIKVVTNTTGWEVGKKGFVGAKVNKGGLQSRTIKLNELTDKKICNLIKPFTGRGY